MSWHYLQGQEAASWDPGSADGAPSALLSLIHTVGPSFSHGSETATSKPSLSGTMSALSTEGRGEGGSMSSPEASLARTYPRQESELASTDLGPASGESSPESLAKSNQRTASSKTPQTFALAGLSESSKTLPAWGTLRGGVCSALTKPAVSYVESACGLLPSPTTVGNEQAPPMQKHAAHRRMRSLVGRLRGGPFVSFREWMMGWPIGWTALEPLETARFQEWLRWHGRF